MATEVVDELEAVDAREDEEFVRWRFFLGKTPLASSALIDWFPLSSHGVLLSGKTCGVATAVIRESLGKGG